jgi:hypothetical protein
MPLKFSKMNAMAEDSIKFPDGLLGEQMNIISIFADKVERCFCRFETQFMAL